jgi:hypothetical protein
MLLKAHMHLRRLRIKPKKKTAIFLREPLQPVALKGKNPNPLPARQRLSKAFPVEKKTISASGKRDLIPSATATPAIRCPPVPPPAKNTFKGLQTLCKAHLLIPAL